jgi:hypothetical protein
VDGVYVPANIGVLRVQDVGCEEVRD